jgi:lysozyme family protein
VAIEIYHRKYWLNVGCDELPAQVGILVFDAAVNQGPETAVELLQAEVGTKQDGKLGPKTLAAVHKRNHDDLASQYAARRGARYGVTAHADRYMLGWMRRLFDCYRLALMVG